MASNLKDHKTLSSNDGSKNNDVSSPGKIFIGGLARSTTSSAFTKHFSKYGELTDSVIMKDRLTGQPRGFGFVTYADPSVIDKVIQDSHAFDGKTVEIKKITIPKGNSTKGPKTKKIFVGGIPTSITEDEFKDYFSKFGKVVEHQIMKDRSSGRSRGFGFITFDSEQAAEEIISQGRMLELGGKQVEIKKAEPMKSLADAGPVYGIEGTIDRRPPYIPAAFGGFGDSYSGFPGYGSNPYGSAGDGSLGIHSTIDRRVPYMPGAVGGFGDSYSGFPGYGINPYGSAGDGSLGIHSTIDPRPLYIPNAVGGLGDSYSGFGGAGNYGSNPYGGGSLGNYTDDVSSGYGMGDGSGAYGGSGYGGSFDSPGGGPYRRGSAYGTGRGSNGGSSNGRYHPYAR